MKWFKHDANAQSDAKLEKLRIRYGMEGYGLYWYCLELIVGNIEIHNIRFELEHDSEIISHRTGIHADQVQEMMKYMVELGLFENNDGRITCWKLVKRLDTSMTSNPTLRKIIKSFHENHDPVMTPSGQHHDSIMPDEMRLDENIYVKKNKNHDNKKYIITNKKFKKPTLEQVTEYCHSRHNDIDPEQFIDFYDMKNWMVGKSKMCNWQAAVRTWERNNKTQETDLFAEYR